MQFRRTFGLTGPSSPRPSPCRSRRSGRSTEKLDLDAIYRIKDEGLQRSKVMEIESYLTDVYGPRLTGSPNMKEAGDWAMKTMKDWGLANVHDRDVAVRPRLAEPALHRQRADAARLPADRATRRRGRRAPTARSPARR